jgi:hypothetical protein
METRRYRTIVRGRFRDLDETRGAALVADAAGHDALKAAFTEDGTFTYDRTLKFFAFRYQFDVTGENAADCDLEAELVAEDRATTDLAAREILHGPLTVSWTCMSEMRTERRKAPKRPKATAL